MCKLCDTVLCVQSSGKLEMERGMVKPMIRGEQQDSRSHTLLLFPPLLLCLPSLSSLLLRLILFSVFWVIFSSHGFILCYQVSGHFGRQSRVDAASRHRVQRQLWVWVCLSIHCFNETVNSWKLLNPTCSLYRALGCFCWTNCSDRSCMQQYVIVDIWVI